MVEFEQWLAVYGLNAVFVGLMAWIVFVEIPLVFVLRHQIKNVRKATHTHLNNMFPSVWNYPPRTDVVVVPRTEWINAAGFDETTTLEYKHGWDKAKIVAMLVFITAVATHNYWLFILFPVAVTSFYQGKLAAAQSVSQRIFDLKEQPWITRNRFLNESGTSMHFDNLPTDFEENPIVSRDVVGGTSFHLLDRA